MPNVSDLVLKLQTGTDSTYFATWDFKETTSKKTTTSSSIKSGDWVTIKSGASYYNGVAIPSWVFSETWKVVQVTGGDRAVLGVNKKGGYDIQSPISTKYLSNGSSGGSSTTTSGNVVKYLDHYQVKWHYATGDGVWFVANDSTTEEKQSTYGAPSNATKVKVSVKPISKTYKVNDEDVSYWTGSWVSKEFVVAGNPPEKPNAPTVTIEKYKLTAKIENVSDARTDQIQFEVYSGTKRVSVGTITVRTCRATYTCNISAGEDYRVRCRSINIYNNSNVYSAWSDFSSSAGTIPSTPSGITEIKALSETSISVSWSAVTNATGYGIEYTTKKIYFDTSSDVKSTTVTDASTTAIITGLSSGEEYFFRVKATNGVGDSGWTAIKSVVIGKKPAAPTTWSSTTTAITGESVTLYWVHNSEDGSSQTYAELQLYIGDTLEEHTIKNTADDNEKDKTSHWALDTSSYVEGTTIKWRVRTAGITKTYGDWSAQRTIDVYAPATLQLSITDVDGNAIETLTSFPFYIRGLAGPKTQAPIGYHVQVTSDEQYETVDTIGNPKMVNSGEEIYSKYFDISDPLILEMSPSVIDLENNISYTITCTVSMDSGLTAEVSSPLRVEWTDVSYEPDAEIGIDEDTFSAYISPYCIDTNGNPITDITLSVYRREFDGSFTEIATGIDTAANEYILDPHPSLDYARYRIVATSKTTGAVSYYDPPGYPVGGKAVVIQWDDTWSNFDTNEDEELETPPWSGSMLQLPYNIDVSDKHSPDTSLVEYAGREHPVSYYGTQLGTTATWSMAIPKEDKDTLYALRRLARWMGDVYVREPSGSGYWASITVSFSQKHCELTIPVTLDISQVEGGM